jgi:murein DD-endopeptidase MepM/ murein hydrolase activator NlpD
MRKRRSRPSRIVEAASGGFLTGAIAASIVIWCCTHTLRTPKLNAQFLVDLPVVAEPKGLRPDAQARPHVEPDSIRELRDRGLELPVRGTLREDLRDSFSERRGSTRSHEAIDIMAPRNTPILAVEDGTIARLFDSKAGGTTVYQFDPTTTYVYYYAHLERYVDGLREGLHVQRGQVLGYVGTSGNAPKDAPHLHFAIFRLTETKQWWRGSPIDPYAVLK